MQSDGLIKLIEEMIELKIRQHAAATARANGIPNHLARVISEAHYSDNKRLEYIRGELAGLLAGVGRDLAEAGRSPQFSQLRV